MKIKDNSRTLQCNFMPIRRIKIRSVQLNFIQCIPMSLSVYQDQIRCISSPSSALETLCWHISSCRCKTPPPGLTQ
ncbi:hypothetical protein KSS87_014586, partial [Heliosperma pusillum]